jgi:hypothetical protein
VIWIFSLLITIQIALWIYFTIHKKYKVLILTGLCGAVCIFLFVDAYLKYIYRDPCEGTEGCFNETGMIFVFLIGFMLLITFISLTAYAKNRDVIKHKHDRN